MLAVIAPYYTYLAARYQISERHEIKVYILKSKVYLSPRAHDDDSGIFGAV